MVSETLLVDIAEALAKVPGVKALQIVNFTFGEIDLHMDNGLIHRIEVKRGRNTA